MSYLAGVIGNDKVHIVGDRRAYRGEDTVQKANSTQIGGKSIAFAAGGDTALLNRVQAETEILEREDGREDISPSHEPKGFAQRLAETLVESPLREYSGVCLVGGYDSDGPPKLVCATISGDKYNIECHTEKHVPIHLPPPSISSDDEEKERFREMQCEIWKEEKGDIESFLSRIGKWVAENDSDDACSKELDIVDIEGGNRSR